LRMLWRHSGVEPSAFKHRERTKHRLSASLPDVLAG
jgi:hypothetical protein